MVSKCATEENCVMVLCRDCGIREPRGAPKGRYGDAC